MMQCSECGKKFEEELLEKQFVAFDLQHGYEQKNFCCVDHLESWMKKKIGGMIIALILGAVLTGALIGGMGQIAIFLFFVPYMIRQVQGSIGKFLSDGSVGEVLYCLIILLASLTVFYPAYKLYQEVNQYMTLKKKYLK